MNKIQQIKTNILKKIKPSKKDKEFLDNFVKELIKIAKIKGESYGADPYVVGSTGKQTWLKGDHDIDIFMIFPQKLAREDLEKRGMGVAKKIARHFKAKTIIKYAEHPYLQAIIKWKGQEFKADIVPCYRMQPGQKIKSAVDRSPLHLAYILKNLEPTLRDEVRILKQFCKGIGIYGSDVKTEGISGYICELLVINYGPFEDVLKAVAKWDYGQTIDLHLKAKKKFRDPLVIIDPVDSNRNAAAAFSTKNFFSLVENAKAFLKKPSEKFFFSRPKPLSKRELEKLHSRETKFLGIVFDKPDIIDDTLYPQMRKARHMFTKLLERNDFRVLHALEWTSPTKAVIVFELEAWFLPAIKKMVGPPVYSKKHSKQFLDKYSKAALFGPYIEDNRWAAEKKREFRTATDLLKSFLKQDNLRERGIPENLVASMKKAKIFEHDDMWLFIKKEKGFSQLLKREYF